MKFPANYSTFILTNICLTSKVLAMQTRLLLPLFLLLFLVSGCARVDYMGNSLPPTNKVDLYFSANDIEKEYYVLGMANAVGIDPDNVQEKLIEKAKRNGADAILFLDFFQTTSGEIGEITNQNVRADFLKYKE
jgi:hypothetical protein